MKIEVLGTGCPKCNALETVAKIGASRLGITYELTHVKDIMEITKRGVMMTPALVIDGEVKVSGRVPSESEITTLLTNALAKNESA